MRTVILFLVIVSPALAQLIVSDPINTSVSSAIQAGQAANHLEVLRRWAEQLEKLNRQLRLVEDQLAAQQRIRDAIGDPNAASPQVILRELGATDLARSYGETLRAVRRLAYAADSLRHTSEGIFEKLEDRTALRSGFTRQNQYYRRYAVVEKQAAQLESVQMAADQRSAALQSEIAVTLEQAKSASTQAEVDKLNVKVAALNGQLAEAAVRRRDAADSLRAQQILNENQAAKERQDLLERQIAEERQSLDVTNAWQQSIRITPTAWTRP